PGILNLKSRLVRIILKVDVLVAATQIMQRGVIFNHQIKDVDLAQGVIIMEYVSDKLTE
ncbi:hypothetical protein ACNR90_001936, partial [Candidozyma auris]